MLKSSPHLIKNTNVTGKQIENVLCLFNVLFLYEHEHIGRFSNLH